MSRPEEIKDLLKKAKELDELVKFLGLTYRPLHADSAYAIRQWQMDRTSQFWSRTAFRCLCAAIEALLFSFRNMAKHMGELSEITFDPLEIETLSEKRTVENKARVRSERPKYLPFPDAVKESFRLFAKGIGANIQLEYGEDFNALCKTFEVRNRLMHPKKPSDIEITPDNIKAAERGINWFNKSYVSVVDQCQDHNAQKMKNQVK